MAPYPHLNVEIYKVQHYTYQTLHTSRLKYRYELYQTEQTILLINSKIKCSMNSNKRRVREMPLHEIQQTENAQTELCNETWCESPRCQIQPSLQNADIEELAKQTGCEQLLDA